MPRRAVVLVGWAGKFLVPGGLAAHHEHLPTHIIVEQAMAELGPWCGVVDGGRSFVEPKNGDVQERRSVPTDLGPFSQGRDTGFDELLPGGTGSRLRRYLETKLDGSECPAMAQCALGSRWKLSGLKGVLCYPFRARLEQGVTGQR